MKNLSGDQARRSRQPAQELPTASTPKLLRALFLWIKLKKKFDPNSGVGPAFLKDNSLPSGQSVSFTW